MERGKHMLYMTHHESLSDVDVFFHPLGGLALWWYKSYCVPIL